MKAVVPLDSHVLNPPFTIKSHMLLDVYFEHKMITSTLQTRIHFQLYQVNVIINRASLYVGETIIP